MITNTPYPVGTSWPVTERYAQPLISAKVAEICQYLFFTVLCQTIDVFGIVTNIINIICFTKQGFQKPINVSLFALSVADLGCLTTLVWTNICITPAFVTANLPFDPIEFQYMTTGMLHTTLTRLSGWITALVTLERCMCIANPLNVKEIITSKRMTFVIACIVLLLSFSVSPLYVVNRLERKFSPLRNKTLIGIVSTKDRETVDKISFAINNIFIPFSAFGVIIVCTVILVVKLRSKQKWLITTTSAAQAENISNRNRKVTKMVVMISTLFIVCFIPVSVIFLAMTLEPKFSVHGQYQHMLIFVGGFGIILESINSSVNIFFYYSMSNKYRIGVLHLFQKNDSQSKKGSSD